MSADNNNRLIGNESNSPNRPSTSQSSANIAQSPPRFVGFDEINQAASGLTNMFLAHQIAIDGNFRIQRTPPPEHSLRSQVESALKQAFWDILQSQLNESPPNFKQALSVLDEIKRELCGLLVNQESKLKQEIDEILDLDLIKQQAEHGALDFQRYAQYILSVMARLCAPIRDEQIAELTQSSDVITLFKGIMEVLELMKIDMANFTISQMRPHIVQHSAEYERQKFLESFKLIRKQPINMQAWLDEAQNNYSGNRDEIKCNFDQFLCFAYVHLLRNPAFLNKFPETLEVDRDSIFHLMKKCKIYCLTGSLLLITFAAASSLQSDVEFKRRLKQHVLLLLSNFHVGPPSAENETSRQANQNVIAGVADYILSEVTKELSVKQANPLTNDKIHQLRLQIESISEIEARVGHIVERRLFDFLEFTIGSNELAKVQIPNGLTVLQDELIELAACVLKIFSFNRSAFERIYFEALGLHI